MGIELAGVTKRYGSVTALEDVSLTVQPGQFHCLLGPNGSGKTTLVRLALGLTRPTEGTVSAPSDGVGCGFQEPSFYPGLSVRENLGVFGRLVDAPDGWRADLVERLRLGPALDRPAGELSGGYARKLDLALALLSRPEYLLLDEPLDALDDVTAARLLSFLADYAEENAVFVSTHRVGAFSPYVDRVTVVHAGRVLLDLPRTGIDLDGRTLQKYYVDRVLAAEGETRETRGAAGTDPVGRPDTAGDPDSES
jgi:ABC-2 type transport system ATP-binding protein